MSITTEQFVAAFHSLNGTTIGERRKNLFALLNKSSDSKNIDFNRVEPRTPLEEVFKVETLIHYKNVPELIKVLKSNNPILMERILKISFWFLERLLEHVTIKELMGDIFPLLSFNTKAKIINKMALHLKSTQQADAIFEALHEKYGLYLASKLLPSCSKNVILKYLQLTKIEITPRQLLIIIKRYPELTEEIFKILGQFQCKLDIQEKYKIIFAHVLHNDVALFLKITKGHQPCFHLGWRATKTCIATNKPCVIKNPQQLYKVLHKKQVVKTIVGKDFDEFYFNMLPTLGKLKANYNFYLDLVPAKVNRMNLVTTTFQRRYGSELWTHPVFITAGLLELMSADEREAWMQTHPKPSQMSKETWTCLMKTEKSLPELMKMISLTSEIPERAELVGCLVETCRINDDKAALTTVCKYVNHQLRNDNSSVLNCFLSTLKKCICPEKLDDDQWKCINEIIQLFTLRKELPYYQSNWRYDYISYRLAKNLPIREQVKEMALSMNISGYYGAFQNRPLRNKQFMLTYWEVMEEVHKPEDVDNMRIHFLHSVITFNSKHPAHKLPLPQFKEAFHSLLKVLKNENEYNYMADMAAGCLIRITMDETEKNDLLNLYLRRRKNFNIDRTSADWLILNRPLTVLNYVDELTNAILNMWYTLIHSFFWKCSKNYSHLEIPQKMIAICLKIIKNKEEGDDSRKKNAILALSDLMRPEEFLKLVTPYYPSDLVMDVNDSENQETYKIQQAITGSLKNIVPPYLALESVSKFSKGDYLKFIQRSLHSVAHSATENKLAEFLDALIDRPVSVRKHAIYLTFKVLDKTQVNNMLTKFTATEKNSSIRKVLFKAVFSYFAKNPEDHLWELVKENARAVDVNDKEALDMLMEINKVPPMFLAKYIMFTWNFFEAVPNQTKEIEDAKSSLLDAVSSTLIASLPDQFCVAIIQKYLFKFAPSTTFQSRVRSFAHKYVLYGASKLAEERVAIVFEILKDYVSSTWYKPETRRTGRKYTYIFLINFCSFFINDGCRAKDILVNFIDLWNNFLKPHDAFYEFLYLQLTLTYVDFTINNLSLPQLAEKIVGLYDSLGFLSSYGPEPVNLFSDQLKLFIDRFTNSDIDVDDMELEKNRLILIKNIIATNSSAKFLMLAISLLPNSFTPVVEVQLMYNEIMQLLDESTDPLVQLSLGCYFKELSDNKGTTTFAPNRAKRAKKARKPPLWMYIVDYSSKYVK